ncbi:hypothetical protein TGARI_306390 [Toxoplasma gondii ARI]|uniref:Uncharacterized protein n=1 Tax=Toxoplasma gondii ARI TaxID=1074872 RepID=A0A139Y171_TOXGO|nr:hypothetical protein TGARI_306390 [Toxoplasma gondii ARI]
METPTLFREQTAVFHALPRAPRAQRLALTPSGFPRLFASAAPLSSNSSLLRRENDRLEHKPSAQVPAQRRGTHLAESPYRRSAEHAVQPDEYLQSSICDVCALREGTRRRPHPLQVPVLPSPGGLPDRTDRVVGGLQAERHLPL